MKFEIDEYVMREVRRCREAKGLSQEAISYLIGRTGLFVGNIENGTRKYSVAHLNLLAIALHCRIQDFFPPEPIEPKKNKIL